MSPADTEVKKQNKKMKKRKQKHAATSSPSGEESKIVAQEGEERTEELEATGDGEEEREETPVEKKQRTGGESGGEEKSIKKKKGSKGSGIMTDKPFSDLPLSEATMKAIQDMKFVNMTQVLSVEIVNVASYCTMRLFSCIFTICNLHCRNYYHFIVMEVARFCYYVLLG
jgi:ATP-dependent RNA helicase DDX18/HAS1